MPNNYLSVLYKHIIQVEKYNVGLKVWGGGGHKHTIAPNKKVGGGHKPPCPPPPPPVIYIYLYENLLPLLVWSYGSFGARFCRVFLAMPYLSIFKVIILP